MTLDQLTKAFGLLERVQIFALDILDQRKLGDGRFVDVAHDRGDRVKLRPLRGPPAPFARNNHEAIAVAAQKDRLQDPALADRLRELFQRFLVELRSRLLGVGTDPRDLDLANPAAALALLALGGRCSCRFAEQRRKPHPEPLCRPVCAHAASASCGKRPISSRARRT